MLNFSPLERKNFYPLTHYSKDLFNNALLLIRALYNLPKYNKNTSWKSFWDIYDKLLDMLTPLKKIKDSEEKREVIKRLTNIREKIRLGKGYGTKIQIKSLQGDLFYLLKYLKSYKSIGHAKVAQETLKAVNQSWLSTTTLMRDWLISKKNKEKNLGKKPRLPYYLLKNGEFLVRYNRQTSVDLKTFRKHLQNTARIRIKKKGKKIVSISVTAEFRFPDSHAEFIEPIRVNLLPWIDKRSDVLVKLYKRGSKFLKEFAIHEFCKRFRTLTINPIQGNYFANISYTKKKKEKKTFDKSKCISIDLGLNVLLAVANNFGKNPLLYRGGDIKRANYRFLENGSEYMRGVALTDFIIRKYYKKQNKISVLQIISDNIKHFKERLKSDKHICKLKNLVDAKKKFRDKLKKVGENLINQKQRLKQSKREMAQKNNLKKKINKK